MYKYTSELRADELGIDLLINFFKDEIILFYFLRSGNSAVFFALW
jgi:hypothetical protein